MRCGETIPGGGAPVDVAYAGDAALVHQQQPDGLLGVHHLAPEALLVRVLPGQQERQNRGDSISQR